MIDSHIIITIQLCPRDLPWRENLTILELLGSKLDFFTILRLAKKESVWDKLPRRMYLSNVNLPLKKVSLFTYFMQSTGPPHKSSQRIPTCF